jgi:hypothetical protein
VHELPDNTPDYIRAETLSRRTQHPAIEVFPVAPQCRTHLCPSGLATGSVERVYLMSLALSFQEQIASSQSVGFFHFNPLRTHAGLPISVSVPGNRRQRSFAFSAT